MKTHAEDIFKCDDCAKSFDYQDNLEKHVRTHSFEPRLDCSQSEKKSNSRIYQMNQSDKMGLPKMINMNGSRLGCDKCGKRFQGRTSFFSHRPGHINPNSCPSCQKLFNRNKNLWKHVSNHHSNKKCTVGDQTLARIESFDRHAGDNHRNNGEPGSLSKEGFSCQDEDTHNDTKYVLDLAEKAETSLSANSTAYDSKVTNTVSPNIPHKNESRKDNRNDTSIRRPLNHQAYGNI